MISFLSPQIEAALGYPMEAWERPGFWLQVTTRTTARR